MKNIIDEINKRYENLTKSQKIIADFLLENYALVPFETLNEIAHRIGLSTTSLIRFSRTMGYKEDVYKRQLLNPPKGCPFAARCSRAMKLCAVHQPPFCDLGNGHVSACWLHNESVKARIGEVKL